MKVLIIDYSDKYYYPEGIKTLESFVKYANANYNILIPLYNLMEDNCCHPYYIEEDSKLYYVNVSNIKHITEEEVNVLSRLEYEKQLEKVVQKLCVTCSNYTEELDGDNLKGHRGKLCLDGTCWGYSNIEDIEL